MTVVWFIVKAILYTLLSLLGLLIVLVMAVLFLPITYEGEGSRYEDLWIKAKVRVFYGLSILFQQEEGVSEVVVKLFGMTIYTPKEEHQEAEPCEPEIQIAPKPQRRQAKEVPLLASKEKVKGSKPPPKNKQKKVKPKKTPKPPKKKKPMDSIKEAWDITKTLWTDENRRSFFKAIKRLLRDLWRAVRPKYLRFRVTIGRESPDETGQLLALLAFLFPFYYRYGSVVGDFEEAGLWGELRMSGKIRIWQLIRPLVVLILNRPVRDYIHLILNVRKEEKHGNKT